MGNSLVKSNKNLVVVQLGLSWIPTIAIMSFHLQYAINYISWFILNSFFFFFACDVIFMVVLFFFLLILVCVMFLMVLYVLPLCVHDYACVAICNGDFPSFACAFAHGVAWFDVSPLLVLLFNTTCNGVVPSFVFAFFNVSMYINLWKSWNMRHKVSWPYNDY